MEAGVWLQHGARRRDPELKIENEGKGLIDSSQLVRVEATG